MKKFKKVYKLSDIQKDHRVKSIHKELEGFMNESSWWCYLREGWQAYGNEQMNIHEPTIKEVCRVLNNEVKIWEK